MFSLQCVLFVVVGLSLSSGTAGETLYEALARNPNLTEFYKMVNKDEVLQVLLDRRVVTIFAPTNDAVREAAHTRKEENKLPSFHVLNLLATFDIFPASVPPYLAGVAPLFLTMKDTDEGEPVYFVNNAKIIHKAEYRGTEGGTQLLYVIDELLEPYKPITTLPPTALDLLKQPSIYKLTDPLDALSSKVTGEKEEELFMRVGNHTYFIPIGSVDAKSFQKLQDIDPWVVRGHVILNHVLFMRTMSRKSYRSQAYSDNLKVELKLVNDSPDGEDEDSWYIESNTIKNDQRHRKGVVRSKIVKPNIPVSNGVVHLISHPLMVIDKTIWELIDEEGGPNGTLQKFHRLASRDPEFASSLRNTQQKTVFAPTDAAFSAIDSEKLRNMMEDRTAASNLLELHMVIASVSTQDVWNGNFTSSLASDNKRRLYFRVVGEQRNKTFTLEGGGVNATAVMADLGATNGILHVIDRVLGMPYLTVYNKLRRDPDLDTTFKLSQQDQWNLKLNDKEKSYTFFVPNKKAWEDLKNDMPSEHKQLHMGDYSYHVHKILDRHLVVGNELSKEDLAREDKIQMVHGMFKISAAYDTGALTVEWEGLTANIVRPDVQATNGVIHVIDRVMMKRRDLTKSGSPSYAPGSSVLLSVLLLAMEVLMFRL